jgi:glycosyltransferase involved in cell wall biosynthesis
MKVLHLNQSDIGGGAAIAAQRLQEGLRRLGVDSRLLAPTSVLHEETTTVLPPMSIGERIFFKLTRRVLPNFTNILRTRKIFDLPVYRHADVVHFHNLHTGLFFNYLMIPRFTREKPVVFALHDMWAFTGHCSYSLDCERWRRNCGKCPYPEMYPAVQWDNTAIELWLKKRVYAKSRLTIVTPSRWLSDLARQSILGRFPVHTIPYGLDTKIYQPMDRAEARRRLGLPMDKTVLLFACAYLNEPRKGMDLLLQLLRHLPEEIKKNTVLYALGNGSEALQDLVGISTIRAGYVQKDEDKVCAYSAADVFIATTLADNLPLVLQESLACGTPMLATEVGGVSDVVRHGVTGFVAPPERVDELGRFLLELITNHGLRREMSVRCREVAVADYDLEKQAQKYRDVYEGLLAEGDGKTVGGATPDR